MKKIIVIYESKYGFTKRYAQWIAQDLSCKVFPRKAIHPDDLKDFDTIIYGGGLYAGGVSGISLLTKYFEQIKEKNIVLFTCGLADPQDPDNIAHIRKSLEKVLTPEMLQAFHLFHFRGEIDYSGLSFVHKAMMGMLHQSMLKKDYNTLRKEDKLMLDTYGKKVDFTDKDSIEPLVGFIKNLC